MQKPIAVLTGDIVKSSRLTPEQLDQLFTALEHGVDDIKIWSQSPEIIGLSRFRGDGWQLAIDKPELALRISLFLRASIRATSIDFQTRIATGIGAVQSLDSSDLGRSTGSAFEYSGHCLDGLKKKIFFGIQSENTDIALLQSVFVLCDALSADWTERQALVMRFALAPAPLNQAEIGQKMSISQSAVTQHFDAAHGAAIFQALEAVEGISALNYKL